MVVPGGPSSSYSTPLDPYPPPAPYYPGYSPGPGPACYSHPPSTRNLAFIGKNNFFLIDEIFRLNFTM